jgi:hypothetical protein
MVATTRQAVDDASHRQRSCHPELHVGLATAGRRARARAVGLCGASLASFSPRRAT